MPGPQSGRRPDATGAPPAAPDPLEPEQRLFGDLHSRSTGLSDREAERRLTEYGENTIRRRGRRRWWEGIVAQLIHPLALLLWAASGLAWLAGTPVLAGAIVAVILINAIFALFQERQAERAVEALAAFLPEQITALRGGRRAPVEARLLVPGDVIILQEGDRVPADARLIEGRLQIDISALTGESVPVTREAGEPESEIVLEALDLVFSGTSCTAERHTRSSSRRGCRRSSGASRHWRSESGREESPLEAQVRRVAKLIAIVATVVGAAFLPLGLLAGLTFSDALVFSVGLLVANVPEGLLPTITLSLAVGVRSLARSGALVKRLSAVETLGSTTVICTDKTGTLTLNRMRVVETWVTRRRSPTSPSRAIPRRSGPPASASRGIRWRSHCSPMPRHSGGTPGLLRVRGNGRRSSPSIRLSSS